MCTLFFKHPWMPLGSFWGVVGLSLFSSVLRQRDSIKASVVLIVVPAQETQFCSRVAISKSTCFSLSSTGPEGLNSLNRISWF